MNHWQVCEGKKAHDDCIETNSKKTESERVFLAGLTNLCRNIAVFHFFVPSNLIMDDLGVDSYAHS